MLFRERKKAVKTLCADVESCVQTESTHDASYLQELEAAAYAVAKMRTTTPFASEWHRMVVARRYR